MILETPVDNNLEKAKLSDLLFELLTIALKEQK